MALHPAATSTSFYTPTEHKHTHTVMKGLGLHGMLS